MHPTGTTLDLFGDAPRPARVDLGEGAVLLPGLALSCEAALLQGVAAVVAQSPWRCMSTPGGQTMSVALTNCGPLGWVSDRRGYRYAPTDPLSGQPWPTMPPAWPALAREAASQAGFEGFAPDAGLVNRYEPGARMSLHQDRNERDFAQPIVSVSLGVPAVFLFGGQARSDRCVRVPLVHGDVVVWGGPARLRFHGVMPVAQATHPAFGSARVNITLRRAG